MTTMTRAAFFLAALFLCSPRPTFAQSTRPSPDRCAARDSLDVNVFATLGLPADSTPQKSVLSAAQAEQLGMALSDLFGEWRMPAVAIHPDSMRLALDPQNPLRGVPAVDRTYLMRIASDGRVTVLRASRTSGITSLDSAVAGAIDRVSRSGALWFMAAPDTIAGDTAPSAEVLLRIASVPDSLRPTVRLGTLRLPLHEEQPARLRRPLNMPYPEDARRDRAEASLIMEVRVRENGRPDMRSLRVVRGGDERLVAAARNALAQAHFSPAMRNGCPVPIWVQMPLNFRLTP